METFVQLIAAGVVTGTIYALVAGAYAVLYTATGFVNFALGAQAMIAGYFTYVFFPELPLVVRILLAIVVSVIISVGSWALFYRRVAEKDMLGAVIMSFGFSIVMAEIIRVVAGGIPLPASSPVGSGVQKFGILSVANHSLLVLGTGLVLFVALALIFRSRGGMSIRAMFQDKEMAETLGIPTNKVVIGLFALSGVFAAASGVLIGPILSMSPHMGTRLALIAFVGAILGGLGRISTAIIGAIVLGLLETLFGGYVSQDYRTTLVFSVFIIVLLVRPVGIFGTNAKVKV
jgi:branched-chain amino acid transport system permease protein